jgi:hypothetical protein
MCLKTLQFKLLKRNPNLLQEAKRMLPSGMGRPRRGKGVGNFETPFSLNSGFQTKCHL